MTFKEALNILELGSNASPADAQKAYRKLAKHFHPDKNSAPDAATMFRRINEAYQLICDEYDRQQVEEAQQQEEARQQAEERRQEEEARRQAADAQQQVGQAEESKKQGQVKRTESVIEKHYWHAVTFLVAVILIGAGFWGLRRFNPALFLGKPDFIAVPNEELPERKKQLSVKNKPALLNINTALAEELETLSGIGPQMAQRIIQYREENGNFTSVDALTKVKGLGEKTLEKLKPFISVE